MKLNRLSYLRTTNKLTHENHIEITNKMLPCSRTYSSDS